MMVPEPSIGLFEVCNLIFPLNRRKAVSFKEREVQFFDQSKIEKLIADPRKMSSCYKSLQYEALL